MQKNEMWNTFYKRKLWEKLPKHLWYDNYRGFHWWTLDALESSCSEIDDLDLMVEAVVGEFVSEKYKDGEQDSITF